MYHSIFALIGLITAVSAKNIDVKVGDGGIIFTPNTTAAVAGDTVTFHFYDATGPHSVVSSSFDSPCVPDDGAFYSGLIEGDSAGDMTFQISITSSDPIWYYCSARTHCEGGMVGVINPPNPKSTSTNNETLVNYAAAAKKVPSPSAPAEPTGGVSSMAGVATGSSSISMTASESTGTATTSMGSTATASSTTSASSSETTGSSTGTSSAAPASTSKAGAQHTGPAAIGLFAAGLVAMVI